VDTKLYIVTEVMHDNLNNIIRAQRLKSDDIRYIIFQIANALNYLHTCGIVHGDLKPSDIGINKDMSIKLIDLNAEQPKETDYVLTKWYRAPELLFAWKPATERVDLWSLGCIMAELTIHKINLSQKFKNNFILFLKNLSMFSDLQQLKLILELLGTPSKDFFNPSCHFCILTQNLMTGEKYVRSLPYFRKKSFRRAFDECNDDDTLDFLERLLILEPMERNDIKQALKHPYFKKYPQDDIDNVPKMSFEEIYNDGDANTEDDNGNWINLIRENVEIKD
jgi:p38 MAP kinase